MAKKLSPFEEAFKEARAEGKKTFTFNGKSYGTVTADDEQKRIDKMPARVPDAPTGIQAGTRYVKRPNTPTPPNTKARSLVDQGRGVQLYKDVDKEAVLNAGLGLASVFPAVAGTRMAYTAARPAIGAAARYFSKKDSPAASVADDIKEPAFNPEKMVDRSRSEPAFNPDKMVDRRSTTFPGRTEQKFNPEKMTGYDRPEPMKKGGKVSSASSRGDGIAQRGKTKGRMR
jgi:hypothetical protein